MTIVPLSALHDNYIWAMQAGQACVVVDPGEAAPVNDYLAAQSLQLTAILLTHRHHDHIGGVDALCRRHAAPVIGPRSSQMPQVTQVVEDGERFACAGIEGEFEVLAIPGHTEEHIAFRYGSALFCGDTLFGAGCGRLMGGTPAQFHASLQHIAQLPPDTLLYCAHEYTLANLRFAWEIEPGNPAIEKRQARCAALRAQGLPTVPLSLAEELETNPFLRTGQPAVSARLAAQYARPIAGGEAAFTALRQWKDQF